MEAVDEARPPAIRTPLTDLFGIRYPILLAPMALAAGGALAAAVTRAGGLGIIGGGYADRQWLEAELAAAGDARVGVGFITFALEEHPEALDVALAHGIGVVELSFGDPGDHARKVKDAGALLICQVQSDEDLDDALGAGADVIVAQGRDAGGHGRAERATFGLVPSVVDRAGGIPVVAAGGIADGRGLAAALMLGAAGVSLGTRMLATREARASEAMGRALVEHRSADTVRTQLFDLVRGPAWPAPYDGRAIRNAFVDRWGDRLGEIDAVRDTARAEYLATEPDDFTVRVVWAGEGLDLIHSVEAAADVVTAIAADAVRCLRAGAGAVGDR